MTNGNNSLHVSVIIPCFNQQALLSRALKSCLQQTYQALEIIVVDDGSEQPIHYPEDLGPADSRVSIIRQDNAGVASARNLGIAKATGRFIKFLDADDELLPDCIWQQVNLLTNLPNHLCFCGYRLQKGQQSTEGVPKFDSLLQGIIMGNVAPLHAGLYPTEIVRKIGGFDTSTKSLAALEDYDFHWKLALAGIEAVTLHEIAVIYHKQPEGRSTNMQHHFTAYIHILLHHLTTLVTRNTLTEALKVTVIHSLAELAMQSDRYEECYSQFYTMVSAFLLSPVSLRAQRLGLTISQRLSTACSDDEARWWQLLATLCPTMTLSTELTTPAYAFRCDTTPFASQQFDAPVLAQALHLLQQKTAVWLWGKGVWCRYWLHILKVSNIAVAGIIDSHAQPDEHYLGYACIPAKSVELKPTEGLVICSRDSYLPIRQQCIERGWETNLIDYIAGF